MKRQNNLFPLLITLLMALSAPAFATGGFWCQSNDGKFSFSATTGRVSGSPIVNYQVMLDGKQIAGDMRSSKGIVQYYADTNGTSLLVNDANAYALVRLNTARIEFMSSGKDNDHEYEYDDYIEAGAAVVYIRDEQGKSLGQRKFVVDCSEE